MFAPGVAGWSEVTIVAAGFARLGKSAGYPRLRPGARNAAELRTRPPGALHVRPGYTALG
jgi:hypothetical protein